MAEFSINVKYDVDSSLILSATELVTLYLTDIPLRGLGGEKVADLTIETKIRAYTEQIEGLLNIKIPIQRLTENQDFDREQFYSWGHIQVNYQINSVVKLEGHLNFARQIVYPKSWLSWVRNENKTRQLHIIPGQQAEGGAPQTQDFVAVFSGKFPLFAYSNSSYIPNYWFVDYITGFEKVPKDLEDIIGKLATIQVLAILGDISFGAGIASASLSLDGVSQSINTTQSAENALYSARVRQFQAEVKSELLWLQRKYKGVVMVAL